MRHQLTTIHRKSNSDIARAYFDHLERVGAVSADATIVANNWLKNLLTKEFDTPEEQISVLHYGYDIDSFLKRKDTKSAEIPQTDKKLSFHRKAR
ncbi:hypothetical protein PO124_03190 [Bacillus licheniformis]|nr:hypothetical protein [Bacillus licheniformis]